MVWTQFTRANVFGHVIIGVLKPVPGGQVEARIVNAHDPVI